MIKHEIVPLNLSHLDQIMILEDLCFRIPWTRDSFVDEITNNKVAHYFVLIYEEKVIGYIGMWKILDEGHITNLAVHPKNRGQGFGKILLEYLIDFAIQNGITSMTLEVRKSNVIAQGLYSKYGFINAGERKKYYEDNNENAIIMWKNNFI